MKMANPVREEQKAWAASDSLEFFQTHRQRPEDLYPSEKFFLPDVLPQVQSVLDIGCAAGGFSRIMKSFNPAIAYTGVDINPEFVAIAQRAFPDSTFIPGDGIHFETPDNSYDLVHSSGILHLNSRYEEIVRSCYAQARRYLACDFRLTPGPRVEGTFTLEFQPAGGQRPVLPYIVLNVDELVALLTELRPAPRAIRLRGYYHPPSSMADLPIDRVLMAAVLVEKGPLGGGGTEITIDLPPAAPGAETTA
jgi:SAM-dependent methyltransferase